MQATSPSRDVCDEQGKPFIGRVCTRTWKSTYMYLCAKYAVLYWIGVTPQARTLTFHQLNESLVIEPVCSCLPQSHYYSQNYL